jgi:hypothetical protein
MKDAAGDSGAETCYGLPASSAPGSDHIRSQIHPQNTIITGWFDPSSTHLAYIHNKHVHVLRYI